MRWVRVYNSGVHLGEETIVHGNDRSGLVNFSGCHLSCNFCYTPETSMHKHGIDYTPEDFEELIVGLVNKQVGNLNLISPTLEWPVIEKGLLQAKSHYADEVPLILKISGYEGRQLVRRMSKICDIWVPDFKVFGKQEAKSVNLPGNYGDVAALAIQTMMETHSKSLFDTNGKLIHGIVVRHLMMPGFFDDSIRVVECLGGLDFKGYLNLMTNYMNPTTKRIQKADAKQVTVLRKIAERYGISVLVNGGAANG